MDLFTSFQGRIGRRRFLFGMALLVAIGVVIGLLTAPLAIVGPAAPWTGLILSLVFLYPALALMAKRLHDRGRPALPSAAIYVGPGLALNLMQAAGIGFEHRRIGDFVLTEPTGLGLAATAVAGLVAIAALVDLCLLPGRAEANAWGPARA